MSAPPGGSDTALLSRIVTLELQVKTVQEQLRTYIPQREHDLQLAGIQNSVTRIEHDVTEIKAKMEENQKAQDALQIKVLWGAVSTIISIAVIVVAGYITHIFR